MSLNHRQYDVIIIGVGAAGLMCAIEAGKRGRRVLLLEHTEKVGKKILISGGGRCNFTNIGAGAHTYHSENEHFCKSALSRFTQFDFIDLVEKHGIEYYEKTLGQLFCRDSSRQIVAMLIAEAKDAEVEIRCSHSARGIQKTEHGFSLETKQTILNCESLVIATGGISIPKMGATGFGYDIAKQFGLKTTATRAGLVPFVFDKQYLALFKGLSGISISAEVRCQGVEFAENILITHRGVSGPAILQISSYWRDGKDVEINLLPGMDIAQTVLEARKRNDRMEVKTLLSEYLPKRFVDRVFENWLENKPLRQLEKNDLEKLSQFFHHWIIQAAGTEGYRTAEVTCGGIDTQELSSKTFESRSVPGLYFIGEVIDVTGWLGGYNFQWAWSSGYCAGQYV